jgi:hypothetical protein
MRDAATERRALCDARHPRGPGYPTLLYCSNPSRLEDLGTNFFKMAVLIWIFQSTSWLMSVHDGCLPPPGNLRSLICDYAFPQGACTVLARLGLGVMARNSQIGSGFVVERANSTTSSTTDRLGGCGLKSIGRLQAGLVVRISGPVRVVKERSDTRPSPCPVRCFRILSSFHYHYHHCCVQVA